MSLQVHFFPYGPLKENTYLIIDNDSHTSAIIDPGYYGSDVEELIGDTNTLNYIILTHGHFDHLYATQEYLDRYPDSVLVAPLADKYLIHKDWANDILTRGMSMKNCPEPHNYVSESDNLKLGSYKISFIETPGHTEGGMCIYCSNLLFSGDTLFRLSVGNTSLETGNWQQLVDSIRNKLYVLDDNTTVYPGHGLSTTIGYEKKANPFV